MRARYALNIGGSWNLKNCPENWNWGNIACVLCFGFLVVSCGFLAPRPEMKPAPLLLDGKVLTTGLSEKSRGGLLLFKKKTLAYDIQLSKHSPMSHSWCLTILGLLLIFRCSVWMLVGIGRGVLSFSQNIVCAVSGQILHMYIFLQNTPFSSWQDTMKWEK